MADGNGAEFNRGRTQGEVDAMLKEHGLHLSEINGSMHRLAIEMHDMVLAVQRLGDAAEADRQTVKVTAVALKEQDQARRDKGDQRWQPWQKLLGVVVGLGAAVSIVFEIVSHIH